MIYSVICQPFALRGDNRLLGVIEDWQARPLTEGEARELCKLVSCVPLAADLDRETGYWTVRIDGRHLLPYERDLVAALANAKTEVAQGRRRFEALLADQLGEADCDDGEGQAP